HDLRGAIIQIDGWDVATAIRMVRLHATNSPSPQLWESRDYEVSVIHSGELISPRACLPLVGSIRSNRAERDPKLRQSYSNAGDRTWQVATLNGTRRIQTAISERAAANC